MHHSQKNGIPTIIITVKINDKPTANVKSVFLALHAAAVAIAADVPHTDVAAEITKKSITVTNSDYFKVTTSVDTDALKIARNNTGTVTVTVELIKMPITVEESTTSITVKLNAAAVQ